jgi:hypothetical protein
LYKALNTLFNKRVRHYYFSTFVTAYCMDNLDARIERDLGIKVWHESDEGFSLDKWLSIIEEEIILSGAMIKARNLLKSMIDKGYKDDIWGSIALMCPCFGGNTPMRYFNKFCIDYSIFLYGTDDNGIYRVTMSKNSPGPTCIIDEQFVEIRDGKFHVVSDNDEGIQLLDLLNESVSLALNDSRALVKTHEYLKRLSDNILSQTAGLRELMTDIDILLDSQGNCDIEFVPTKDSSLYFRSFAGNDCSSRFDSHVAHPRAYFYRVLIDKSWIGYMTLLDIADSEGRRSLLIDVLNMRREPASDPAQFFREIINNLADIIEREPYDYLLLPENKNVFSNMETFRDSVYDTLGSHMKIQNFFSLIPENDDFHSMKDNAFIVAADFRRMGQLKLFEYFH